MRVNPNCRTKTPPGSPRPAQVSLVHVPPVQDVRTGCHVVPILRRKRFEWSYLGGGGQQQVLLQSAVQVASFYYVSLWVRVHELSFSAGQIVGVALYDTFPCEDDAREFTKTSSAFASLSFNSSTSPPALLSVSGTGPGPFLKALLIGYQDSAPGTFYVELSAALVLRSAQ